MTNKTNKKRILSFRITSDLERMVSELEQMLKTSKTELITQAIIDLYHRQLGRNVNFFESLQRAGLVGCFEEEADLSTNYKNSLSQGFESKYDNS